MVKKYSNLSFTNQTVNGVQFNLVDNYVLVNGTSTGPINFTIGTIENLNIGRNYKLRGVYNGMPSEIYADVNGSIYSDNGNGVVFPTDVQNGVLGLSINSGISFNNRKLYPEVIKNNFWENSNLKTIADETLKDIADAIRYAGRFVGSFPARLIPDYINQLNRYSLHNLDGLYILKSGENGQFVNLFKDFTIPDRNNYLNDIIYVESDLFNASGMFRNASNVGNVPFMTNYITDMSYMYSNTDYNGNPICGPNVTNMSHAYEIIRTYSPPRHTGEPVCGPNVTDMSYAYCNGLNYTGNSACGDNVFNMCNAYYGCLKLTGKPACGNSVEDMSYAYYNCRNLNQDPTCGQNVINMSYAYYDCRNLIYFAESWDKVKDMSYAYYNCQNIFTATCGNNVENLSHAFENCINIQYLRANQVYRDVLCGPNVKDMSYAYSNCINLEENAECGINVIDARYAYFNCKNLNGQPVCGENVKYASYMYCNCNNLNGQPVCGNNVKYASYMYCNCNNLTGFPYVGNNVVEMGYMYAFTTKLSRNIMVIGPNVGNAGGAYYNSGNYLGNTLAYFVQDNPVLWNANNLLGAASLGPNVFTIIIKNIRNDINVPKLFNYIYVDKTISLKKINSNVNNISFQYGNNNIISYFGENPEVYYANFTGGTNPELKEIYVYKEVYNSVV